MASADVSALVDIASSSPQTDPTPVETPEVPLEETPETEVPEETPETPEQPEKPVDARTNPAAIRNALKTLRDSSPENAPIARELNNIVGRYGAYKQEFPTVAAAREAKALLDAVGGNEGLSSLQSTIKSVNETDQALYAGDPKVLDSIIEDMKSEGKLDAFTKLAGPYLERLRGLDEKAYFDTLRPHFFQGLVDTGFPSMLQAISKALTGDKPDAATAKALLDEMSSWFDNLRNSVESTDKSKLDPERQAFQKEVSEFQTAKQKEFETGVAATCETQNNRELGTELGKYLKMPFFKGFSRASIEDLGIGIKQKLFSELKADKTYQSQMDAFFSVRNPDKAKIEQYHASKVKTIASRIVKSVIETRYPNYSRTAGAAKPVVAAKPGTPAPTATNSKPLFVTAKPKWEELDMTKDPQRLLFATGRGYRKSDGKLVAWSAKYK